MTPKLVIPQLAKRKQPVERLGSNINPDTKVIYVDAEEEYKFLDLLHPLIRYGILYAPQKFSAKRMYNQYWLLRKRGYRKEDVIEACFRFVTKGLTDAERSRIVQLCKNRPKKK